MRNDLVPGLAIDESGSLVLMGTIVIGVGPISAFSVGSKPGPSRSILVFRVLTDVSFN